MEEENLCQEEQFLEPCCGRSSIFSLPDLFHLYTCLEFSGTHLCHYLVIASDNFQLLETQMSRFRNECSYLSQNTIRGGGKSQEYVPGQVLLLLPELLLF